MKIEQCNDNKKVYQITNNIIFQLCQDKYNLSYKKHIKLRSQKYLQDIRDYSVTWMIYFYNK